MLQNLLNLLVDMYIERLWTDAQYCGYGATIDEEITAYMQEGGDYRLIRRLEDLAYQKAWTWHKAKGRWCNHLL